MVKYNIDIILIYCCQIIPLCMQGIRHCLIMFKFAMIEISTYCTFHFHKAELNRNSKSRGRAGCKSSNLNENFPVQTKIASLSWRPILLAILLCEQFIYFTQITVRPNHRVLYHVFLVLGAFVYVY